MCCAGVRDASAIADQLYSFSNSIRVVCPDLDGSREAMPANEVTGADALTGRYVVDKFPLGRCCAQLSLQTVYCLCPGYQSSEH